MQLRDLSITEAARRLRRREFSPAELVSALLQRIEETEPLVRAWETIDTDGVMAEAERAGQALMRGDEGLMLGVPIGVKDVIHVAGLPTVAGFQPFRDRLPAKDAGVVSKLKSAGALILGKNTTMQFAYGADPVKTRNPWRLDHTPGGSSSGSAAAVAARMVPAAVGTQTGGSTLRPSAYCGVVGLKPTFGRVSRSGIFPVSWSMDHPGIIARSVEDASIMLTATAGYDTADPVSIDQPAGDYIQAATRIDHPPRLGILMNLVDAADMEVHGNYLEVAKRLERAGARLREVRLPATREILVAVHTAIFMVEGAEIHSELFRRYPEEYGPLLRAQLQVSQLLPGVSYLRAQRIRRHLRPQMERLFSDLDVVLAPTSKDTAPILGESGDRSFQSIFTLFGFPNISIPTGLSPSGVPFAVQLISCRSGEDTLLNAAGWCEQVLGHLGTPSGV